MYKNYEWEVTVDMDVDFEDLHEAVQENGSIESGIHDYLCGQDDTIYYNLTDAIYEQIKNDYLEWVKTKGVN